MLSVIYVVTYAAWYIMPLLKSVVMLSVVMLSVVGPPKPLVHDVIKMLILVVFVSKLVKTCFGIFFSVTELTSFAQNLHITLFQSYVQNFC